MTKYSEAFERILTRHTENDIYEKRHTNPESCYQDDVNLIRELIETVSSDGDNWRYA